MRGSLVANVRKYTELLKITDDEKKEVYYLQTVNMQGQVVGSMNAFIKKVGGAIIGIDNSLRTMAEKVDPRNPNKELRKAVEELANVEKLIK
jgi:hypothetical protein